MLLLLKLERKMTFLELSGLSKDAFSSIEKYLITVNLFGLTPDEKEYRNAADKQNFYYILL